MTQKDYKKVFKQLKNKPGKMQKYIKNNAPKDRSCGLAKAVCEICGKHRGVIRKYTINLCRQCFRENAYELGFKKYH